MGKASHKSQVACSWYPSPAVLPHVHPRSPRRKHLPLPPVVNGPEGMLHHDTLTAPAEGTKRKRADETALVVVHRQRLQRIYGTEFCTVLQCVPCTHYMSMKLQYVNTMCYLNGGSASDTIHTLRMQVQVQYAHCTQLVRVQWLTSCSSLRSP